MKKNIVGDLEYYTFEAFDRSGLVKHAFTTKKGGFSQGHYASLNLSYKDGEDKAITFKNFEKVTSALEINIDDMVFANQTHMINVRLVDKKDRGNGILRKNVFNDIDALITNQENVCLVTFHADCVPIFLLDTKNKAIGLVHAGWRGTRGRIVANTLDKMKTHFNTNPIHIIAGIGPSICQSCFEVDEPVALEFDPGYHNFIERQLKESGVKYHINLQQINKQILTECGVSRENIEISCLCSKCLTEDFYSHRISGSKRGNMAAMIELIK